MDLEDAMLELRSGDINALSDIYQQTKPAVYATVLSVLHDRYAAEDAVQDSFLKIAKNASRFERNTNGVAWVMRIVRNTALDYLKRERKISTVNVDECYDLGRDDPMLERSENAVLLERALARLPEQERKVIYYRYYLDFTVRDIAKETGIPKSTVMRLIRTAEENLKKMLSDRDKDTV